MEWNCDDFLFGVHKINRPLLSRPSPCTAQKPLDSHTSTLQFLEQGGRFPSKQRSYLNLSQNLTTSGQHLCCSCLLSFLNTIPGMSIFRCNHFFCSHLLIAFPFLLNPPDSSHSQWLSSPLSLGSLETSLPTPPLAQYFMYIFSSSCQNTENSPLPWLDPVFLRTGSPPCCPF